MKINILPFLILLILQTSIFAQKDTTFHSTFEIQGGIGMINLLGYKGEVLEMDELNFYSKSITDITHSGRTIKLGVIASRRLKKNFWIQSGLQMVSMRAKASYAIQEKFDDGTTSMMTSNNLKKEIKSLGLVNIPILFEYRYNFENWGFYSNSGVVLSYSKIDIVGASSLNLISVKQHGATGTFGLGVLLNQRNWSAWRFGYRLSVDLLPFNRGNNIKDKIYHPIGEADRDYRHLVHQLDFSFIWPEREIILDQSIKDNRWIGWFLGTSLSFQTPFSNSDQDGRKGVGRGRNVQLKWIGASGFGLRWQFGQWIAPASNRGTRIRMTKTELLYQLPYGLEITTGIGFRVEADVGTYRGLLIGTGGMFPLNSRLGLQLDISGHYVPKYDTEKLLLETGIGFVINVF